LDLFKSGIKGIAPGAFENMDQLERLDLGRNELTELKASTFRGLRRLRELTLRANDIREIAAGAFLGLRALEFLDLSDNTRNHETDLKPGCFAGLGKLRELKLGHNYINSFQDGVFRDLTSLEMLDLKGMWGYVGLGCVHAFAAGLSTAVACSDNYNYEQTAPFFAGNYRMDYAQAVSYCASLGAGAEIAVIESADENERARRACGRSACWLGLEEVGGDVSTPAESQIWRWCDGSEAAYLNWDLAQGEPQNKNKTSGNGERWIFDKRNAIMNCCGTTDVDSDGEWRAFLGEWEDAKPLCRLFRPRVWLGWHNQWGSHCGTG